ncbi:MAG: GIY-YIG nuclease family protein [Christensenellaceae bacterium]|nr:GIY-YIG nuclease family protein [Christensenellaceae bacterium]
MADIYLSELFTNLSPLKNYKIHFAKCADGFEPLVAFMRDMNEWREWNSYSNAHEEDGSEKIPRNDFNRDFIFSLISFYPERNTWLFGGIWRVVNRNLTLGNDYPYEVELCDDYSKFIGRLKIKYAHNERRVRNNMETYFPRLIVKELLEEKYSTHVFPGYKNLDIPFRTLENVILKDNQVWKNALSIKGIYLITDTKTVKKYVGKAAGEYGIWQRWNDYIVDGHGGDVDLIQLVENKGMEYVRQYYKFTLLEIVQAWDENSIDDRENYWKRVLMTREESTGHNKN